MCIVPAVCMLIAYVVYRKKYKLNDGMMKKVINTISARREGKIDMTQQLDESGNTEPSVFLPTVTEKAGK